MKPAREYIEEITVSVANLGHIVTTGKINGSLLIDLEKIINTARREALEEAAEKARTKRVATYDIEIPEYHIEIDKKSILSLINDLK